MKTTVAILALEPDSVQHDALVAYAMRYAEAGNWTAQQIAASGIVDQVRLNRLYYAELRARFSLPSQTAVLLLKQVARLSRQATEGSMSWRGPIAYDRHLFSLKSVDRVSLATLSGRAVVPCAIADYRMAELAIGSAELRYEADRWLFHLRTALSDDLVRHAHLEKEPMMSDKLLNRITRLVSGLTHNALSQAEQAAAVPTLEQAVREIDEAVKEVRAEIGKEEATKHNVNRRLLDLQAEYDDLDQKIGLAMKEGREDLAEVGAGRQIDIENQLKVLHRTLGDADDDIAKLGESLSALQASRRETQQRLRDLKAAQSAGGGDGGGASNGGGRGASAKAAAAIEGADRLAQDLTGVPGDQGQISHKDLDELAELHRRNEIQERLAKHRAGLKSD